MANPSPRKTVSLFLSVIFLVVILSMISSMLWGGKPETLPDFGKLTIDEKMTIRDFGQVNHLSNPALKEIFGLQSKSDLEKKLSNFGRTEQIRSLVTKKLALAAEHETKNWQKIVIKFCLWFSFLFGVFYFFNFRKISPFMRKMVLFLSVMIFGIIMGSDPSPMGTVKDAIHLYGASGAIFPPRMIALTVFLLMILVANKYICAWGCQLGVLQDLIFRINQTGKKKAAIGKQIKVPFVVSNGIRVAFLCIFTIIAFAWGVDIIDPIDPFKIYKPAYLSLTGAIFVAILLLASLFIYRPWCHFFCPFGLVGWLVEKVSRIKVSVDYQTCIACQKCATACPTHVMASILRQDKKTIPDCFACYTCRDVCPTESIRFSTRKRTMPPALHFERDSKNTGNPAAGLQERGKKKARS